jgi:hypothetical protein
MYSTRRAFRLALIAAISVVFATCSDQGPPTDIDVPSFAISDATRSGNPDFFFGPPITRNGNQHPDFEPGEFNANLGPAVTICVIDPALEMSFGTAACYPTQPAGFPIIITLQGGPAGHQLILDAAAEYYQVVWNTELFNTSPDQINRVVASVGATELGFADVIVLGHENFQNVATGEVITMKDARRIPIRLRIENGALCDPDAEDCASETIDLANGGTIALQDGDNVNVPAQGGGTNMTTITVTPCVDENSDPENLELDLPLFGDCLDITADPPITTPLATPAIISICSLDETVDLGGLSEEQEDLVTLHRQDNGQTFALPHEEDNCTLVLTQKNQPDGLMQYASAALRTVRDGILSFVGPQPLEAARVVRRLDIGRGGATPFFSRFQYALPAQMFIAGESGEQSADVGTAVPFAPVVVVLDAQANPQPVAGATIHFMVPANGGGGTVTPMQVVTDALGRARVDSWVLGPNPGVNLLNASGRGVADPEDSGPFQPNGGLVAVGTGQVTFTATGVAIQ